MNSKTENLTTGSLWKKIFLFAMPLAATSVLQQLFNAADLAIAGRFTGEMGELCMAAVGSTGPIIGLIVNAFVGLSIGTNVIVANAIGKGDRNTVFKAVHTSILFSVLIGVLILLMGDIFAKSILVLTGVPESVLPLASKYLQIYFMGTPAILLYNFESAIFRAKGDTKTPLVILAVSGLVNVLLNMFFVIVLKMTVDGVAIATITSNIIGAVVLFFILLRSTDETRVSFKGIAFHKSELGEILKIGVPSGLQASVFSISNIVMQSAINSLDTTVMAGSSAAINVEALAYFIFTGFAQACVTFVGQNRGAQKFDRCRKTLIVSLTEAWIGLAVSILILVVAGRPILSLFNTNPAIIDVAYRRLTFVITYAYFFSALYDILGSYLRGMGISLLPAVIAIIGVCGTRITWVLTVFKHFPTFDTILCVFPLSMGITALIMTIAVVYLKPDRKIIKQALASADDETNKKSVNIITIGREFGSGGRELGKRLADSLGYKYYDKELVVELAARMNTDEAFVDNNLGMVYKDFHYVTGHTFSQCSPIKENNIRLITEQRSILKKIAQAGENCVIVGRAADISLSAYSPLKLFVYADLKSKLERCKARANEDEPMTDKRLAQRMKQIDKARANYYDMISTVDWGDRAGYHLCINTSGVDIKSMVPMIADYAREWFEKRNTGSMENG